ncbi:cupin domain-containing protein, partial [bacterium]
MKITIIKPTENELEKLDIQSWSAWECGESTFDWHYDEQETAYIKSGKVKVKTQ